MAGTMDGRDRPDGPGTADTLDLEDLLDELRSRASSTRRSQERVSDLLAAVLAVSADLELPEVLARIVHSGMSLVDARYGALGVVAADGEHLIEFITAGVTPAQRAMIGEPPRGHGILGLLIRDPRPRRLRDIATHPDSFGFPPNHPAMHSFLGTPIHIREEVFGNLYMAEKQGAEEFSDEDETILVALAAAAGVAIDNARMYDLGRRRREWAEAIAQVTTVLLEGADEDSAAALITAGVGRLGECTHAVLVLQDEADELVVRHVYRQDGQLGHHGAGGSADRLEVCGPHWHQVSRNRGPVTILSPHPRPGASAGPSAGASPDPDPGLGSGAEHLVRADVCARVGAPDDASVAILPLAPGRGDLGVLALVWAGRGEVDPGRVLPELAEYAGQAGLALLAGRSHRDRSQMALSDDRDRIARDMHDHVIQRLFATGLSLQSAGRVAQHPMVATRLDEAVDELDVAIKEIRHAIYELHQPRPDQSARQDLTHLVQSFARGLGFVPTVLLEGPVSELDPTLRSDVTAVLREGLSNVMRHAGASSVDVQVHVTPDEVRIEIVDDGVGLGDRGPRSGLANLDERASTAGGTFDIHSASSGGTVLGWCVPLDCT